MATKRKAAKAEQAQAKRGPVVTVIDPDGKEHKGAVVDGSDDLVLDRNVVVDGVEVTATAESWTDSGWRWRPAK